MMSARKMTHEEIRQWCEKCPSDVKFLKTFCKQVELQNDIEKVSEKLENILNRLKETGIVLEGKIK